MFQGIFMMFLLVNTVLTKEGSSRKAAEEYKKNLINYDRHLRPFVDEKPTEVAVQVSFIDIGPLHEKDFTFRIDFYLRKWWHDPRLNFSEGYVNINGNPKNEIWIPDLYIRNSHKTIKHEMITETIRTQISHNGRVYMSSRISAVCVCKMNLRAFPMDSQTCHLHMESYSYNTSDLVLKFHEEDPYELPHGELQIEGYKLLHIKTKELNTDYVTGDRFSLIELAFEVERTFLFYVYSIYLPSTFLVLMTWGTFYVPATSYPARCGLIVTNFLASLFILRGASEQTPRVPYTTAIELYMLVNIIFIVLVVLEYILVIQFSEHGIKKKIKKMKKHSKENGAQVELVKINGDATDAYNKPKKPSRFHPIDRVSMVLIPAIYILFLIAYFAHYLG